MMLPQDLSPLSLNLSRLSLTQFKAAVKLG